MKKEDVREMVKEEIKVDLAVKNASLEEVKALLCMNLKSTRGKPGGTQ